ncbi:MAG: ABC transporter ATP-binding protein [Saprospiraceae bacterium]|nr:ABC transporter ATP-binding protein [Saprospiraceae bacterium]
MIEKGLKKRFKNQFSSYKNLIPFFKMIWATSKRYATLNIVLRVIKATLPLSMLYVGKEIIDTVLDLISDSPSLDTSLLWTYLGIELGLAIISEILNRQISLIDALLGDLFSNKTSVEMIQHAATLDLYQFEDSEFYDKMERARRQTVNRSVLMSMVLEQLQDLITLLFLGAGILFFNPWLILILALAVIPNFLGEAFFNAKQFSLTRSWTPERRELDYFRYLGVSYESAKEIKVFNLQDFISERFKKLADRYFIENKKIAIKRAWVGASLSLIGTLAYYGAYVFILIQTLNLLITVGTLTFLAGSFSRMRSMLQAFTVRITRIADSALYLQDLFDFFAIKPNISDHATAKVLPSNITKGIEFENVSFKYDGVEQYAIRNLSFIINPGEKIALVGENGAGKTTIVKLLSRLYDPTEGRILIDGVDIKDYKLSDLRNAVGIIFQDYQKLQMSVRENIAVGNIGELNNQDKIESAAYKSLAKEVVESFEPGYDQILGKRFKSGVELSGGQWQKIAIARAYMRDSQILILDEPTSALDARAEHQVFLRFAELIEDKIAVLISHRFSTVRMADKILFLEHGQKLEYGSHDSLIKKGGKYAELFNLQAAGYK